METPMKHSKFLYSSFWKSVCSLQNSAQQTWHYGNVRSRRGMSSKRWLRDSWEHVDSASTSASELHQAMAVLKWQSWWRANLPKVGFIA